MAMLPLAVALMSAAAAVQPLAGTEGPLLVARADGSWTITRQIREEWVPLAYATDGLLVDEPEDQVLTVDERESMREAEAEAELRRAFEEAEDAAREAQPQQ